MADSSNIPLEPPPGCSQSKECLEAWGFLNYLPSVPANATFIALFTVGFTAQALILARRRYTRGFAIAVLIGILLEIIGYGGRIGLHYDDFTITYFTLYLVPLTLGPAFFSAAIYLSLSRILAICGENLSIVSGRTITLVFISCDFVSLVLQGAGGGLTATADTGDMGQMGVNILIAGLSLQVAATTIFALLCLHIAWSARRHPERVNVNSKAFRSGRRWRVFVGGITIATTTILIRCSFRVAELSEGFDSAIANDEALFTVFEAVMMVICVLALTIAHPGLTLGAVWNTGEFRWRPKRGQPSRFQEESGMAPSGGSSEMGSLQQKERASVRSGGVV